MSEPYANGQIIRYIVNSKDRINPVAGNSASPVGAAPALGSPNNFQVQFKNPIPIRADELWVKLANFSASATPQGICKCPGSSDIKHGFDTKAYIDVCIDFGGLPLTQDTEQGIAEKSTSDRSFVHVPTARMENENCTRLYYDYEWVKVRNPGNLSTLSVKLFSDTGLYLASKNFSCATVTRSSFSIAGINGGGVAYTSTGSPTTQMKLDFASAPANVTRGCELYRGGGTDLLTFIFGQVTVLSVSGNSVTIGFPSQIVPSFPGATASFNAAATIVQEPMDDWSMELLVTTTNPNKVHSRPI